MMPPCLTFSFSQLLNRVNAISLICFKCISLFLTLLSWMKLIYFYFDYCSGLISNLVESSISSPNRPPISPPTYSLILFFKILLCSLLCIWLFVTPWIVAHQAPPSMGFSRQEYWSGFAISFSRGSSQPRDRTCVSYVCCI